MAEFMSAYALRESAAMRCREPGKDDSIYNPDSSKVSYQ